MTPNGTQPTGSQAERAFDAFLDGLSGETAELSAGNQVTASPLAETAHRVHALAAADASMPSAATLRSIREGVMGTQRANGAVAASSRIDHANGSVPPMVVTPRRSPNLSNQSLVQRRPRWLPANASLAAIVLLTIGLGFIAYRIGPGAPSSGDREELSAGVMVSTPTTVAPSSPTAAARSTGTVSSPSGSDDEYFADCEIAANGCELLASAPILAEPGTCAVAPRPMEDITAISYGINPSKTDADIRAPIGTDGTVPPHDILDGIGATVQEIFTCLDNLEDLRAYALFTDNALWQMAEETSQLPAQMLLRYGPREPQEIHHARRLADGHVAARIGFRVYNGYLWETWVFVQQDGRYLVDRVILAEAIPTSSGGQPGLLDCSVAPDSKPGCDRGVTVLPDASECQVEPRTIDEVAELFASGSSITGRLLTDGTPSDSTIVVSNAEGTPILIEPISTPIADGTPPLTELPDGPTPDEQTVAGVTSTWRQYFACGNAGDYFRLMALFSDAGFQRTFVMTAAPPSDDELAIIRSGGNFPVEEPIPYQPLAEMRVLPDGRVGAMITVDENATFVPDGEQWVIFVNIGGRWLIDDFVLWADTPAARNVQQPGLVIGAGSIAQPTEDGVNLRSGPSFEAEPITVLDRSDTLSITGPAEVTSDGDMWWPVVTSDGISGWVLGDFLQVTG